RVCREAAEQNQHAIRPAHEFSDSAVSGTKRDREGLNALEAAADAGLISVLYVFSLSRLARESAIILPFIKKLVHRSGVRLISVTEGIDSNRNGWDLTVHITSIQHERFITELAA